MFVYKYQCFCLEPRRVVQLLKGGERREGKKHTKRRGASRHNQARVRWRRAAINSLVTSNEWQREDDMINNAESNEDDAWWHSHEVETTEKSIIKNEVSGFSESVERHVEVLVVADRSMLEFHHEHGGTDVETYLLTVMNMVSLFHIVIFLYVKSQN
jgi:hypothetical protein